MITYGQFLLNASFYVESRKPDKKVQLILEKLEDIIDRRKEKFFVLW